ncbi:primosomal protein [Pseudonocardia abyssalis]|uniref:Primosomal protein n=1 Tax=Pseudonocardia abyssalis TaxID=2792008 RepID=A0ABS6V1S5_9PSEU|nr:primosomal protein [Pseudonocardia abyssalis]MBW0117323.1 primosomal protein [Pseudonocardia abyssalis]MBW0138206.1 primosomal protein [Pseudonocardia abyssalis]
MASDIVPIQLSLTEGDLVTLWAPRWREDGEEWEAFLGDDDALFAFPEVPQLAAFVRTVLEHDLIDHPSWSVVPDLTVAELTPEDTQTYDVIGVPELVAEDADQWTIGELGEIVDMLRSIADVCGLDVVTEVLDSAPGFGLLRQGTLPFVGREGGRQWTELADVVAARWDDVIDALDDLVDTPEVDAAALAAAEKEVTAAVVPVEDTDAVAPADDTDDADDAEEPTGFWDEVGIHPIRITTRDGEFVSLRCFLDDKPVFLGSGGAVEVFGSERALARWIGEDGADGHDLTVASTWPDVVAKATVGELEVEVHELDTYVLTGLADDIAEGVGAVDATQLEQAIELIRDVGEWAGDDEPAEALAENQPLGWLVSFVVRPNPTRLAPSAPFDRESARFRELVEDLSGRLHQN